MKKVGLFGAGAMGQGIIAACAKAGFEVVVCSSSLDFSNKSIGKVQAKFDKLVTKGKMEQAAADAAKKLIKAGEYADLKDCDIVIEATTEEMAKKKVVFGKLDEVCKEGCILASNTSSLSITAIAAGLKHDVIGMHFFNPADVMKLVEVINGVNTKPETTKAVVDFAVALGKTPVQVKEAPGFVVNRILIPMINEAAYILNEGIADVADIDSAMKLGCNHPMGPLALGDLIGLDVCEAIMDTLYKEFGDSKYRCCPLIRKMVRGGRLGMKTGRGFFEYNK